MTRALIILTAALTLTLTACLPEGRGGEFDTAGYSIDGLGSAGETPWREVHEADRFETSDGGRCAGSESGCVDCINVETGDYRRFMVEETADLGTTVLAGDLTHLSIDDIEVADGQDDDFPDWLVYADRLPNDVARTMMGCYPVEYLGASAD